MKNNNFDYKISPLFTGLMTYIKTDYLNEDIIDGKIEYILHFKHGELFGVTAFYNIFGRDGKPEVVYKHLDPHRWNGEFWLKAPKLLAFDDCKWERDHIFFRINDNVKYFGVGGYGRQGIIEAVV